MKARNLVVLAALAGCALTSKSAPVELRYFTPEAAVSRQVVETPRQPPSVERARLRLGRIVPSAHLRYPIIHRESAFELAPYDTLRWSEPPDAYVRRALGRALFEAHPLDQAMSGAAPTLDVEIVAFEEVRRETHRAGRVELRYVLHDEHAVLARGIVVAEREATGPAIEPVVAAIGSALDAATTQLADRVAAVLSPT